MNEAVVCKLSPVKTLAVSAAPLRELLNFLIYGQHSELLSEQARRQPVLSWEKIPSTTKELGVVLKASSIDKNGKMYFHCSAPDNHHVAVLLDNHGAQFWIHYFRCGVGLVNLSFFNHLVSAESSVTNYARNVTHGSEYQWFAHELPAEFFGGDINEETARRLGGYFIEQVNPTLVYPYSIYSENPKTQDPYKFVSGSLEQLTEVLTWARYVCEGLKIKRDPNGKTYVSPHVTINCGNLRDAPSFGRSTEIFLNAIGALAVKENAPYTALSEGFGRRAAGYLEDWARKNKHHIFLNLEPNGKEVPPREKLAARTRLVGWLKEQKEAGAKLIKTWNLED